MYISDYAYNLLDDNSVSIDDAVVGRYYRCMICNEFVYKKAADSATIRTHWCHVVGTSDNSCPGLSTHGRLIHYLAKLLLNQDYLDVHAEHRVFQRVTCYSSFNARFQFPEFDQVVVEYRDGDVIWDVALLRAGVVVAGVEVYYSHRTPDNRARSLVPWLEISLRRYVPEGEHALALVSYHRMHGTRKKCRCERRLSQVSPGMPVGFKLLERQTQTIQATRSDAERLSQLQARLARDGVARRLAKWASFNDWVTSRRT